MKPYLLLIALLAFSAFIQSALIGGKSLNVQYSGPDKLTVSATLYSRDGWIGSARMEKEAKNGPLQISDMAYDPELNTITICPGTDEDNFYCQTFPFSPGMNVQNSEGRGGLGEYDVNVLLA